MTRFLESLKMAWAALTANKLRAALTTVGVVIGIFFVLLMGWVLSGLDKAFVDSFAFFGEDILYVDRFDWSGRVSWEKQRNRKYISWIDFERARDRIESAEYVVPVADAFSNDVRFGDLQLQGTRIYGTNQQYIEMYANNMGEGRFFTEMENQLGANVIVLGFAVSNNLFPQGDALGRTVRIDGRPFSVIGVMPKRGTMLLDFMDNIILMPLQRFYGIYGTRSSITINVKAGSPEKVDAVKSEVIGVMRSVRSIAPEDDNDFGVNSSEMFDEAIDAIRLVVWSVGIFMTGLSFLVGSIGIMNIMFVSVTERTREIGIRKAVGARRRSILMQFLVESVALCMFGAVIGLVLTAGIAYFKEEVVNGIISALSIFGLADPETTVDLSFLSSTIPTSQFFVALFVAVFVGVLAGIIPAFRAARLDPVEALRA